MNVVEIKSYLIKLNKTSPLKIQQIVNTEKGNSPKKREINICRTQKPGSINSGAMHKPIQDS